MRCCSHHQPGVTPMGRGQQQIQVSTGGGRAEHSVSSVPARRPRGSVEGAICGCVSIRETPRAAWRLAEGQGWQRGVGTAFGPTSFCPPTSSQEHRAALCLSYFSSRHRQPRDSHKDSVLWSPWRAISSNKNIFEIAGWLIACTTQESFESQHWPWQGMKCLQSHPQKPAFCLSIIQQQQFGTCRGGVASGRTETQNPNIVFNHYPSKRKRDLPCGNGIQSCAPTQGWLEPAGDSHFASSLTWGVLQGEAARCDSVLPMKLLSSPEPLNRLFVFKCQSVPALHRGSCNEAEGKGLKQGVSQRASCGLSAEPYSLHSSKPASGPTLALLGTCCLQLLGTARCCFRTHRKSKQKETPRATTATWDLGLQESKETGQVVIPPGTPGCPFQGNFVRILGLTPDKADSFETASYVL